MERLRVYAAHLAPAHMQPVGARAPADSDPVIVSGWRTPFGKAGRGGLAETTNADLLWPCLRAVLEETRVAPQEVTDVVIGKASGDSGAALMAVRAAGFLAGLPVETGVQLVNRACSSGLQSIATLHFSIASGATRCGIAGGMESMTLDRLASVGGPKQPAPVTAEPLTPVAEGVTWTMGQTSERVALRYNVSRQRQDYYALHSQQRAARAQKQGILAEEIVSVRTSKGVVSVDEGVRETTAEGLAKLKPAFAADGRSTAGNSSQGEEEGAAPILPLALTRAVSDGAAAVLMMTRARARELGLAPLGRMVSFAIIGVDPREMGIGPAVAIPLALRDAGLTVADIDVWEINEAFASQFAYTVESLGIPYERVNVNGGAMALGHPLGVSGTRMTITALRQLRRTGGRYAVVSMCIGGGQGAAAVFAAH